MHNQILHPGGLALTELATTHVSITQDSHILDIGCGTGATIEYLNNTYGCYVYGVDISENAVSASSTRVPAASIYQANAESLPFENDSFNAVFMECTLSLFENPTLVLNEAYRVLKPQGALVILTLSQLSGAQIVENGTARIDQLISALQALNFSNIYCEDRTNDLVQFVVDMIFQFGSLETYLAHAAQTIEGAIINCNVAPKNTKYHLIIAHKNE